jgi:5-methylcytosine-specific restriction endonuclease McrA
VFVLDKRKKPLMPATPARARKLLKAGRARVHKMYPFTIRLIDRTVEESEVDGVEVGIDPGSKTTGIAVFTSDTKEGVVARKGLVLIEVGHRGRQISENLTGRAQRRRGRRSRNLRYRAPRFLNRTKPEGWLAPSLRHRVETTVGWVDRLRALAPVTAIHQELVRFDMQKMENPEISGVEYQQGTLQGTEVREYLLAKWDRRCVYCDITDVPLNIDHIHPRARGGTDRVSNLTLACIPCNQEKGTLSIEDFVTDPRRLARILAQAKRPLRDAAAVNATRWALFRALGATGLPAATGSGAQTKWNRTNSGVAKTHALDALCVGQVDRIVSYPCSTHVARSSGRGAYARTASNKYGFPRAYSPRIKQHFGFITGDIVRAVVPSGKKAGTHEGRVSVRSSGSFNVTTRQGRVEGIHHRHVRLIQRNDGWHHAVRATHVDAR